MASDDIDENDEVEDIERVVEHFEECHVAIVHHVQDIVHTRLMTMNEKLRDGATRREKKEGG